MLTALDLFAGAGGATQGLKDAGYRVLAAVQEWSDAVRTFSANHPCPPCQSFSTLGRMDASDWRNDLIAETERFAREAPLWPTSLAATPPVAGDVIDLAGPREGTNIRDMDTADQMAHVVAGVVGRRLVYRDLTADNGRSRVAT